MHRLCFAPMMGYTDACCRRLWRSLTRQALFYSEMLSTEAILSGDTASLLKHEGDDPVALQLGGASPRDLARCARLGEQYGYQEINLNVGCPSARVQEACIGAALMASPGRVADCLDAMRQVVSIPVTIKHRISLEGQDNYDALEAFVGYLYERGTRVFIVHARTAYLKRLSPRDNRSIPPLRYPFVFRLQAAFPQASMVLNGGIDQQSDVPYYLTQVRGVMVGRYAYAQPWACFGQCDTQLWGLTSPYATQRDWLAALPDLVVNESPEHCARHLLSAAHALPGARLWRRCFSDGHLKKQGWERLFAEAFAKIAV